MGKNFIFFIVALVAFLQVSCVKGYNDAGGNEKGNGKETETETEQEEVYLLAYETSNRTAIGDDWTVNWTSGDKLSVFNAVAGSNEYSENCKFGIDNEVYVEGSKVCRFKLETGSLKSGDACDWYVCSPYLSTASNPGSTKGYTVPVSPVQNGYGSKGHISDYDIMVGTAKNLPKGENPSIALHHVCTVMKFHITNASGSSTPITGITLDASDAGTYITGSFSMDYETPALTQTMGSSKSYSCDLKVNNAGTVANGDAVDLYMVIAPFSMDAGKKIKLVINGGKGECIAEKTIGGSGITFGKGTYNNANLNYVPNIVFAETFGTETIPTGSISSYNHDELEFTVTGNASIASTSDEKTKVNNPDWKDFLSGAVVKIVATKETSANSAMYVKGITVEPNTTYIFQYNKSKGKIFGGSTIDTKTKFKYRENGTSSWISINETSDAGTVTQEFTTGNYTKLDIGVEATDRLNSGTTYAYYPAVDLFKLIKKL